jgi:hypothetical protein
LIACLIFCDFLLHFFYLWSNFNYGKGDLGNSTTERKLNAGPLLLLALMYAFCILSRVYGMVMMLVVVPVVVVVAVAAVMSLQILVFGYFFSQSS